MSRIPVATPGAPVTPATLRQHTRALDAQVRDMNARTICGMANRMLVARQRVTPVERRALLAGLAHDPSLLAAARANLEAGAFGSPITSAEGIVAYSLYAYHEQHQACPGFAPLTAAAAEHLGRGGADVTALPADVEGLLVEMYHHPTGERDADYYRALLCRLIGDEQAAAITDIPPMAADSRPDAGLMAEWWAEVNRKSQAATVRPPHALFPTRRIDRHAGVRLPTGIPFIDSAMEDGACSGGKLYGLLGPFGSCKTTLGVGILTSTLLRMVDRGEPGTVAYAVYEDYAGVAYKAIQAVTGIARSSLRRLDAAEYDTGVLSTSAELMGYETAHYRELARRRDDTLTPWERMLRDNRPGERERWEMSQGLNSRFAILDMEDPDCPAAGSSGVAEIEAALDEQVRRTGQPVRLLVVDYLYEMADRFNAAKTGKKGDAMAELKHTSDHILGELRRLALKFGCAVWVLQQMNAEANKKADGSSPHHADAAGSTAFARPLWSCLTIGRPDPEKGGARQLRVTKSRNTPPTTGTALVWDDWTGTLVESDQYTVSNGQIVGSALVAPPTPPTDQPTLVSARQNPATYDE